MKENEAPEKIYIIKHSDYSDRHLLNAFTEKETNNDIEYIRTDVFIEKAAKWINKHTSLSEKSVIESFVNYMEGE